MSGAILQSGVVTPGHVPVWQANGVVQDGSNAGALTNVTITSGGLQALNVNSGPVTGAYTGYGLAVSATGAVTFTAGGYNGGAAATLTYVINGVTYSFPGPGNGDVLGPVSSGNANAVVFNGTGGTVIADAGLPPSLWVLNFAALRALAISPAVIVVEGYATQTDGGGGTFVLVPGDSTSADNGGTILVNASSKRYYRQFSGPVDVRWFGAKGDGTTPDQAAINAALATGLAVHMPTPAASYLIRDAITITRKGQALTGDGKIATFLSVDSTFNMSALGVIVFSCGSFVSSGDSGPYLGDFGITFAQPDTAVRANLTTYPPAIYAQSTPRFNLERVRVQAATVAVDMRGNAGGAVLDQCELCAFNYHVQIDGSLDTVKIQTSHFYNFNLTNNQLVPYYDTTCIGVSSGRCDDLQIDNCLFICGIGVSLFTGGTGTTFGMINTTDFDTNNGIFMTSGIMSAVNCFFSQGAIGVRAVAQTGGSLRIGDSFFTGAAALTFPQVHFAGAVNGQLQIDNCQFENAPEVVAIAATTPASGVATVSIMGCDFLMPANTNFSNPVVEIQTGCRATFVNNRATDAGIGVGTLLYIQSDEAHIVTGNAFEGWEILLPAAIVAANTSGNLSVSQGNYYTQGAGSRLIGNQMTNIYSGTCDGSGNVSFSHGIANLQHLTTFVQGVYRNGSGFAVPLALATITGSVITLTGGSAGVAYRVAVSFTTTSVGW